MADKKLKVIIAGAGIAGLATAIALRNHPQIEVELFDQATELKEIGASIALSPNGLRTLERLGVHNALDDDVAFRGPNAHLPMIYRHWKTNEIVSYDTFVGVIDRRHQTARFHRAHLHQALLQHVPPELVHVKKKVQNATVEPDSVTVFFADGTSVKGDILVGADGIHSKVRTAFVPHHKLKWTGRIIMRATYDASLVEGVLDLPPDSTHWWGLDKFFFASKLGKNQFTIVGSYDPTLNFGHESEEVNWDDQGDVNILREAYKDWNPVVRALTLATPSVRLFPNWAGEALPTWTFGSRVTLVGDAAHTHGGAYAAGGSLAIDDAYALLLSFLHVLPVDHHRSSKPSVAEIERVLRLYEETRRPHTERLLKDVLGNPRKGSIAKSDEELRQKLQTRPSTTWLSEHDVVAAFEDVVKKERRLWAEGDSVVRFSVH
ncbi:monooxygenase [Laetiporus sulphureus 93-53]|uniref:Monooxygenase n=1 Tax=Laetiporus sulphureus 93-53 TaxID=1314785 RepID=A0A165CH66_9APHY|nr:monooxygenase [Laetiporus sulphureus 93-53]KZT02803.1 monooxygenase [Laetiporus sulphureus 93-53]